MKSCMSKAGLPLHHFIFTYGHNTDINVNQTKSCHTILYFVNRNKHQHKQLAKINNEERHMCTKLRYQVSFPCVHGYKCE